MNLVTFVFSLIVQEQGDRPLHIAVRENHLPFATLLVDSGVHFYQIFFLAFSSY
jgi:hypothetical protein